MTAGACRRSQALFGGLIALYLTVCSLRADHQPQQVKAEENRPLIGAQEAALAQSLSNLWEQNYLTGDWGGARTKLSDQGVAFGGNYIGEVFGNPSGGIRQGIVQNGRLELALDIDFQPLVGLEGGSFHANSYYLNGSQLSTGKIGNLLTISNIEAYNTLRLFDLWYQQQFLGGKVSLRFGQLAADDEFFISDYGATFINGTFGWPDLVSANIASGGPAFPLAAPGVRLMVNPLDQVSLLAAVFDGDPGDGSPNPQKKNSSGTRIDLARGALSIFEADYKLNQEKEAKGLPGTFKLGGWYATKTYPDIRTGNPSPNAGDWGVYFVADQMVWRKPTLAHEAKDMKSVASSNAPNDEGLGLFWRIGGSPADRNAIQFYTDGGLNFKGLFPGRDEDVLGLGVAYAKISDNLRDLDLAPNDSDRDYEIALEATYQAKITPWWTLQPDVQYIINPGGNTNPGDTRAIPNAVVIGMRSTINF